LFPGSSLVEYKYKGRSMLVDHSAGDECGIRPCLLGPMYRAYLQLLKLGEKPNILDIGANAGGFSLMLAIEGVQPEKLVAVEMNPMTYSRLQLNLNMNFFPLPTVLHAALTGSSRMLSIPVSCGSTGQSIYENTSSANCIEIPGITLDELIEQNFGNATIDLCKIDIEGAEYEVFENESWHRLGQCRNLLIEIHPRKEESVDRVQDAIASLGFKPVYSDINHDEDVYCFSQDTR
jgi:FkbM family methyltransferase